MAGIGTREKNAQPTLPRASKTIVHTEARAMHTYTRTDVHKIEEVENAFAFVPIHAYGSIESDFFPVPHIHIEASPSQSCRYVCPSQAMVWQEPLASVKYGLHIPVRSR